jgi:uncharacterized protein YecT (DUF1311 family)
VVARVARGKSGPQRRPSRGVTILRFGPVTMSTLLPQAVAEVAHPERLLLNGQQPSFRFADLPGLGAPALADSLLIFHRDNIRAMTRKLLVLVQHSLSFALFILVVAASPCRAQHMNEPDSPCAGVVVTSDLVSCLSKAKDASDAKLHAVYQSLRKKLEGEDADNLLETQRIWLKYRDANCSAERALYEGGTAKYPAFLACIEAMTRTRTKELQITYAVRLKD